MGVTWVVATSVWGFAEATLFFLVPDILLTAAALHAGFRRALPLAAVAASAAVIGGTAMYCWSAGNPASAYAALDAVPAIGPALIDGIANAMTVDWPAALFAGGISGRPFKVYAVEAAALGIPMAAFVAVGAAARLVRFTASIALACSVRILLVHRFGAASGRHAAWLAWAVGWVALYTIYFATMPG
ncbi:MAG: hypothetical protein VW644_01930 [Alphaproteobacteria bacterium]|jgi:membrane protein YqaA with SNARE-associated domain